MTVLRKAPARAKLNSHFKKGYGLPKLKNEALEMVMMGWSLYLRQLSMSSKLVAHEDKSKQIRKEHVQEAAKIIKRKMKETRKAL